jgi:hypothetical protein
MGEDVGKGFAGGMGKVRGVLRRSLAVLAVAKHGGDIDLGVCAKGSARNREGLVWGCFDTCILLDIAINEISQHLKPFSAMFWRICHGLDMVLYTLVVCATMANFNR